MTHRSIQKRTLCRLRWFWMAMRPAVGKCRLPTPVRRRSSSPGNARRTAPPRDDAVGISRPAGKGRDAAADSGGGAAKRGEPPHEKNIADAAGEIPRIDRCARTTRPAATRTDHPQTPCGVRDIAPLRLKRMSIPVRTRNGNCRLPQGGPGQPRTGRSRLIRAMMAIVPANGRAALGRPPEAVPGSSEAARRRP